VGLVGTVTKRPTALRRRQTCHRMMATTNTTQATLEVSDDEQNNATVRLSEIATLGPDIENLDWVGDEYSAATDCVRDTLRAQTEDEA